MRVMPVLVSIVVLLSALSACGEGMGPQVPPADPSPAGRSPAALQDSMPTPAPPAPAQAPSPSEQSDQPQDLFKAPGFSLVSGMGARITLDELLEGHDAVVVVFYRGFF